MSPSETQAPVLLQVTIWNTGEPGCTFEPETYGPTITIQRSLRRTGDGSTSTSSYKVTNARGEKMPISNAAGVQRLLQTLSVNASNPAIVLTQDYSRGMLSGDKVPRKLFALLMDSLGFEQTMRFHVESKEHIGTLKTQARPSSVRLGECQHVCRSTSGRSKTRRAPPLYVCFWVSANMCTVAPLKFGKL